MQSSSEGQGSRIRWHGWDLPQQTYSTTNLILMQTTEGICNMPHNKSPTFLPLTAKGARIQSSTLSVSKH